MSSTVITCLYCQTPELEAGALQSLAATQAAFPDAQRVAGCDVVTPRVQEFITAHGWQMLHPQSKRPPRMLELLRAGFAAATGEYVWTIEHDAVINQGTREAIEAAMARNPEVGACEAYSYSVHGEATAPCRSKTLTALCTEPDLHRVEPWGSLNCVCWRAAAVATFAWHRIRNYPITDQDMYAQLLERGYEYCTMRQPGCVHLRTGSVHVLHRVDQPVDKSHAPLRIGCIIPCRNEGGWPLKTVRQFRTALEQNTTLRFALIDDASNDGCCNCFPPSFVDGFKERNEQPMGEAYNRNRGWDMLRDFPADAVITVDAHMTCETVGGLEQMALAAMQTGGIVCGTTLCINPGPQDRPRYGASFTWCADHKPGGPLLGLRTRWNWDRAECATLTPVQAPYGASYMMTRATWQKVLGWQDRAGAYGYGEQWLAIAARIMGVPVHCHTGVVFRHLFRADRPYEQSGKPYWLNYARCNRILFSDATWRKYFLPLAQRALGADDPDLVRICREDTDIPLRRNEVNQRRLRCDDEILQWLGVT